MHFSDPPTVATPARSRPVFAAAMTAPLVAAALLLAACSPQYDWRTIQSSEGGYAAMYPGKPTAAARDVTLAGKRLPMTMQATRVDDTLFAVGVVTLPSADPALREQALVSMQAGLASNLGGGPEQTARVRQVTVQSAATPPVPLAGVELHVAGVSGQDGKARRLTARLIGSGNRLYQAVVVEAGPAASDDGQAEQVEQFLTGFHPY